MTPIWRFFGADEPNYATMKDGRQLLGELGMLKKDDVYFRAHNLLSSGDGTPALKWGSTNVYTEDAAGNPATTGASVDEIFDAYLSNGVRPFVQLGFMPQALSTAPASVPYKHSWRPGFDYNLISGGWGYPPRDYDRWSELCFELTRHLVQRYGEAEVRRWWFETWNEPNGPAYWKASREEFYKLHDYAIAGVRRALPSARVGGPHTAGHGGAYMEGFLDHITQGKNYATGEQGTPTDFLAFHAKGSPKFVDGHVRMGIQAQLATIDTGLPHDRRAARAGRQAHRHRRVGSRRLRRLPGSAVRLSQRHHVFELHRRQLRAQTRTRRAPPREPAGSADLGVRVRGSAVLRRIPPAGQQRHRHAGAQRVPHVQPDAGPQVAGEELAPGARSTTFSRAASVAIRTLASWPRGATDTVAILVWHYHDDDVAGPDAAVKLNVKGLRRGAPTVTHYRIDQQHSNSYAAWQRMGSPIAPDKASYDALRAAAQLPRSTRRKPPCCVSAVPYN